MSFVQRLINALDARVWQFIRAIISANHDYPYHDYIQIDNESESEELDSVYIVGTSNVNRRGDQKKRFISKQMWIAVTNEDDEIHLNHKDNVTIYPYLTAQHSNLGSGINWMRINTNVSDVYYTIQPQSSILIYCEGVLPQEARDAE